MFFVLFLILAVNLIFIICGLDDSVEKRKNTDLEIPLIEKKNDI